MARVLVGMTMSLGGFVADRHGGVDRLYPDMEALRQSEVLQEQIRTTGAVVMGPRAYDMGGGDFTGYEFQVPIFVLTHRAPERAARGENDRLRFTFVGDGIESAIAQAKAAAGEQYVVVVGGASTAQQCLNAGLLDELELHVAPVLLGGGTRLFEDVGAPRLEPVEAQTTRAATHVRYRVMR